MKRNTISEDKKGLPRPWEEGIRLSHSGDAGCLGSGVRSRLVPDLTVVEIVTCSAKCVRKMTSMAERREREKSDQPSQSHERKCCFNQDYLKGLNFTHAINTIVTHAINTAACQKQGRG